MLTEKILKIWCNLLHFGVYCDLPVWRDRLRRLAIDSVVMRSSPATGHIRYALLVN